MKKSKVVVRDAGGSYHSVDSISSREVRLTVRLTAEDKARLESLRVKLSPYAPLSLGKALSAAIQIAILTLPKSGGS